MIGRVFRSICGESTPIKRGPGARQASGGREARAVLSASTTAGYGEAIVTGQRAGPLWPGERRCAGESPPRGGKRSGGFRGGRPTPNGKSRSQAVD